MYISRDRGFGGWGVGGVYSSTMSARIRGGEVCGSMKQGVVLIPQYIRKVE